MEINNVNDLSKIMQPVLVGLVDQLANRVYETLNFFLQSYYDSYNPVSYRRQYDFLRSAIKVKGRMSRGKAVAYVYIDTESMSNYYNARFMLSVLSMTKQEINIWQGSHHLDMINKLNCITGIQRKKHFKNISYSRNQRLGY